MNRVREVVDPLMSSLMQEATANIRARAEEQAPTEFRLLYWSKAHQEFRLLNQGFATSAERDAKRMELRRMGISTAIRKGEA